VRDFYIPLKEHYSATLIAIDLDSDGRPEINPSLDQRVKAGCTLYYIADNRIKSFDWATLSAH
jgi:voltage-gated potassium channel